MPVGIHCSILQVESTSAPPPTLDLAALRRFHRDPDSVVTFHGDPEGQWINYTAINVGDIDTLLPPFQQQLLTDSYFSINSFKLPPWKKRGSGKEVSRINAAFIDLDFHALENPLTSEDALVTAFRAMVQGAIPPASCFGESGRGIWLFWYLHDPNEPSMAPAATLENRLLFREIEQSLYARLMEAFDKLGPDGKSTDLARVTRIPGSTNSKSGKRVTHQIYASLDD